MFFVAITLLALPIILIGSFVGCGIWFWYALQQAHILTAGLLSIPLLIGIFIGLSLVKSILAPPGEYYPPITLDPEHEKLLFAFIERLCRAVNAPVPKTIQVTTEPNASAGLGGGLSILFGNKLTLTIGLPLVAGLPVKQIVGIIAHELGHFTQGSAMRMGYMVRLITAFFVDSAMREDAWDIHLLRASQNDGVGGLIAKFLVFAMRIAHYGIWLLYKLVSMIVFRMDHEMEFDADMYEMRTVGSDTFCLTSQNLYALQFGWATAHDDLFRSWRDKRLCDNLPEMIVAKVDEMRSDPELASKIRTKIFEEETELFSTHPSTPARMEAAKRENAPGIFRIDAPARVLFSDFDGLCKMATLYYYQGELGPEVTPQNLVPTDTIVGEARARKEAMETLHRYFQGKIIGAHEIFLPKSMLFVPNDPKQTVQVLRSSRQLMLDRLMETWKAVRRFEAADKRLKKLRITQVLWNADLPLIPDGVDINHQDQFTLNRALGSANQEWQAARAAMSVALQDSQSRLISAVQLLHVPQVAERIPNAGQAQERCRTMLTTLVTLESVWLTVLELGEVLQALELLLDISEQIDVHYSLYQQVMQVTQHAYNRMISIRTALSQRAYAFEHARGRISIADYALDQLPAADEIGPVYFAAEQMVDNLQALYFRVIAELATKAELVETAFGYDPLPMPTNWDDDSWQTDFTMQQ